MSPELLEAARRWLEDSEPVLDEESYAERVAEGLELAAQLEPGELRERVLAFVSAAPGFDRS